MGSGRIWEAMGWKVGLGCIVITNATLPDLILQD